MTDVAPVFEWRLVLRRRARGVCEGCGRAGATVGHLRLARSGGGAEVVENVLRLCSGSRVRGCVGRARVEGERFGWVIRPGYDPLLVPALVTADGRRVWVRFTPDGEQEHVPDADAIEYMQLIHARPVA